MIRKVIFVSFVRLSDKTSRDWYVDYLIRKGIPVEYWDVVALVLEDYHEAAAKDAEYLRVLRTYDELESLLDRAENRHAYFVMVVTYARSSLKLYRLFSERDCKMVYIMWGAVPVNPLNRWTRLALVLSDPMGLVRRLFSREMARLYRQLKLVKPFEIIFAGGDVMMANCGFCKKMVPINSGDFEQYRNVQQAASLPLVQGRYAVFLDVYLTHHADNKVCGWSMLEPTGYFAALNRFFRLVEAQFSLRVVIAAHPRADYRTVNPFDNRQIFQGHTPELVRDSVFAISHSSLSQSQAVLNLKPIVFVYTNEMKSVYKYTYVNEIYDAAKYLNASLYNLDEINGEDPIVVKEVDQARYERYKYSFLVSRESESRSSSDIFLEALTSP